MNSLLKELENISSVQDAPEIINLIASLAPRENIDVISVIKQALIYCYHFYDDFKEQMPSVLKNDLSVANDALDFIINEERILNNELYPELLKLVINHGTKEMETWVRKDPFLKR